MRPTPTCADSAGRCDSFVYSGAPGWSAFARDVLVARAEQHDAPIYGQFASTSVAVLAASLTVLAILYALPDRAGSPSYASPPAWPGLQASCSHARLYRVLAGLAQEGLVIKDGRGWKPKERA